MRAERGGVGDRHYRLSRSIERTVLLGGVALIIATAYYGSKDPSGTEINPSIVPVSDNLRKIPSASPNNIDIPGFALSPESQKANGFSVNKSESTPLQGHFPNSASAENNSASGKKGVNVSDLLASSQVGVEVFSKQNPNGEDQTSGTWAVDMGDSSIRKYPSTSKDNYSSNFQEDTMNVNVAMWIPSSPYWEFSEYAMGFSNVFRWIDPRAQMLLNNGNATIIKFDVDKASSQAQEYIHHNPKEDMLDIMPVPGVALKDMQTTVLVAIMEKQDAKSARKMQWYASYAINPDLDIQVQMNAFVAFVNQAIVSN